MVNLKARWGAFKTKHPAIARFIVFNAVSFLVTIMQIVLLPLLKLAFEEGDLTSVAFRVLPIGKNPDGSAYYMFDYAAGSLAAGGGGGLAYFLAVQITLLSAQVANFFLQRKVTFESDVKIPRALFWYFITYVAITFGAAALQGAYKLPLYNLLVHTWNWGAAGEAIADILVVLINCLIQFVFQYPLMHIIFKPKEKRQV